MKIALASDIHLEFEFGYKAESKELCVFTQSDADVLILAGDICIAKEFTIPNNEKAEHYLDFFAKCSEKYKHTIYIMGNHEHYGGDFAKSYDIIKDALKEFDNIHFLEKEYVIIDDVVFLGATLWTDMKNSDPNVICVSRNTMNDFATITNSNNKIAGYIEPTFTPEDSVKEHKEAIAFFEKTLKKYSDKQVVVIGHHAPSYQSVHERYRNQTLANHAFYTELTEFILDHPHIQYWIHGHTHEYFDYMIENTRVLCNPRGYIGYEPKAENYQFKVFELDKKD